METSAKPLRMITPSITRSLILTLLLVVIYRAGTNILLPFQSSVEPNSDGAITFGHYERLSIFILGLMPYLSAYAIVEICSLFIPFLKQFRQSGIEGRQKLKTAALVLTFGLSLYHSSQIIKTLTSSVHTGLPFAIQLSGSLDYAALMATMVAGVFLLIIISELITRCGIGHGISILFFTDICFRLTTSLEMRRNLLIEEPLAFLIASVVILPLVALPFVLLTTKIPVTIRRGDGLKSNAFQFNLCPSSQAPIHLAASVVMLPATLNAMWGIPVMLNGFSDPSSTTYRALTIVCIIAFSYLFASLFIYPKRRISKLEKMGWHFGTNNVHGPRWLKSKIWIYNLPWTAYLCLISIVPTILITQFDVPFYIGGASVLPAVAISLDLLARYRFSVGSKKDYQNSRISGCL